MAVDLTISEERANIFSDLRDIETICLANECHNDQAFKLLFEYWQKVSLQFWNLGYWNDYFRCGNIVITVAKSLEKLEIEAQLLSELGYICMEREWFDIGEEYFQKSLHKYQLVDHARCECRGWRYLGELAHRQGNFESALKYYGNAWDIVDAQPHQAFVDHKWRFQKPRLSLLIGNIYLDEQKPNLAASYHHFKLSLEGFQALGNDYPEEYLSFLTEPLLKLGKWHFLQGDYKKARHYYQDCLEMGETIRHDTKADLLLHLAELALAEGYEEKALQLAKQSADIAGIELTIIRERAARFIEQLLGKKIQN